MSDISEEKERRIKQLLKVVCICKGIPLSKVLPALSKSKTVEEVNRLSGCGTGGCAGERCGPRIEALLKKIKSQTAK
ncbi:(2Fe-2S)-binding protein [Oligoflexaceae bacterium]|nr:(2Fe-2S)-binding protein [Oligoflexaceae bacterium]